MSTTVGPRSPSGNTVYPCLAYTNPFQEVPFWLPLGALVLGVVFCWLCELTGTVRSLRQRP